MTNRRIAGVFNTLLLHSELKTIKINRLDFILRACFNRSARTQTRSALNSLAHFLLRNPQSSVKQHSNLLPVTHQSGAGPTPPGLQSYQKQAASHRSPVSTSASHALQTVVLPSPVTVGLAAAMAGRKLTEEIRRKTAAFNREAGERLARIKGAGVFGEVLWKATRRVFKEGFNSVRHVGQNDLASRIALKVAVEQMETDIEELKELIEAKTCSAYNSNNCRGYDSLTSELNPVYNDDSKVGKT